MQNCFYKITKFTEYENSVLRNIKLLIVIIVKIFYDEKMWQKI